MDIYNLRLFERSFDTIRNQRQFLLDLTPKGVWIVTIDQDEMLSFSLRKELSNILQSISQEELDKSRQYPFSVLVPYFTLMKDINHYSEKDFLRIASKIFYNDRDLEWRNDFHCEPSYPGIEGRIDGKLILDTSWCIFHFAWLDPERMKLRIKNNFQNYNPEEWDIDKKVIKLLPNNVMF